MTNRRPLTTPYIRFSYTAFSIVDVHRLIGCGSIIKATVYQSFFCHCHVYCNCMRCEPMPPSGITRLHCQIFRYSHLDEVTYLCPRFLPLFPYTHTYSVIEPSVDVIYVVLHTCNSVVVKPSPRIHLDFLKAWLD